MTTNISEMTDEALDAYIQKLNEEKDRAQKDAKFCWRTTYRSACVLVALLSLDNISKLDHISLNNEL